MAILSNLEPKRVFEIFEEMCAIPHGSANTKAISDWCVAFGEKLGLEHYQDEANNVILIAPATPGYEDAPAVILQGHVDMVCEKEAGCAKDMDKEGLDLFVDGDLVGAKGTTLGGDDGIAVAMALAALEDTTVQHPRLEVVLTTDEEIGMLGAAVLDVTPLQGRTMLNIDSEEEGIFTVGCAGGGSVFCHLPLIREEFAGETLAVRVSGLVGGHCIGVDPYYLTYRAEQMGYHSQIILSGRRINDDMGKYVAENIVKNLIRADIAVKHAKVAILGFTFKENCPDTRNTKVIDIVKELREYGIEPVLVDQTADRAEAKRLYGVELQDMSAVKDVDALVIAVCHKEFEGLDQAAIESFFNPTNGKKVLVDVKGILNRKEWTRDDCLYWRL